MCDTSFWAIVGKVQTMADGGIRVTFDMGQDSIVQMAELAAYKIKGVVVDVIVTPRLDKQVGTGEQTGGLEERPKRKSEWTTAEAKSTN